MKDRLEMTGRLEGKVAIITGGASGIGSASVRRFVAEGARVIAADIDREGARAIAQQLGDRCRPLTVDVSNQHSVETMIADAVKLFGRIDILFNNAGIGAVGVTTTVDPAEWHRLFAVNVDSVFYACRAAIPIMAENGGGAIINTASISGLRGDFGCPIYGATKGAVINLTRCLAIDHADQGIRANAICPGFIDTPLVQAARTAGLWDEWVSTIPMKRPGTPEDIAGVAVFLASDDAAYVTGATIVADGGKNASTGQPDVRKLFG